MEHERSPSEQLNAPTTPPIVAEQRPFKNPKEPWVIKEDVGHLGQFNLPVILIVLLAVDWQTAILMLGAALSDLGWHQWRHDEHKGRRHIHVPLRLVGALVILAGIYLLHRRLNP